MKAKNTWKRKLKEKRNKKHLKEWPTKTLPKKRRNEEELTRLQSATKSGCFLPVKKEKGEDAKLICRLCSTNALWECWFEPSDWLLTCVSKVIEFLTWSPYEEDKETQPFRTHHTSYSTSSGRTGTPRINNLRHSGQNAAIFPNRILNYETTEEKDSFPFYFVRYCMIMICQQFFFLVKRKQLFSHSDLSDQTDKKMSSIITVWKPKFLQQILVSLSLYMMVSCLIPQLDCEEGGSDASNFGSKSDIMMMITIPQSF